MRRKSVLVGPSSQSCHIIGGDATGSLCLLRGMDEGILIVRKPAAEANRASLVG